MRNPDITIADRGPPAGRLVFGIQPVREAVRAHGARLAQVTIEAGDHPQLQALARFARDQGIEVTSVSRAELDRRAKGARHQGAMAVAPALPILKLAQMAVTKDALFLALDGIEDPQNFGATLRSAVALGASGVLWAEHASAPLSPATFRASAGAVEHAVLVRVSSLPSALTHLAGEGASVVGLEANGDVELAGIDLTGPVVLVIGSEGKGLMKSVRRACTQLARLPMGGAIDSLNASVAAAIALYEARRQRAGAR
ncbi:MAG TPA: 23S rRNA (guanosine(2251)-2'-O)-methyltransferase RlmB [Polyangiaceae bacterium]|nr:23S rRNA (guanosine(2251)-2'-O)-methyltransferase RlmB [Polyangiaceae bacterium]